MKSQTKNMSSAKLDLQKLQKYIAVIISMRKRTENGNEYHNIKFRYCTREDFESRNVVVDRPEKDWNNNKGRAVVL